MLKESIYLVTRNAKGKVQTVTAECHQEGTTFIIKRFTGQLGGKITAQPEIVIEKGKAKRTVLEQAVLEYESSQSLTLFKRSVEPELTDHARL